MQLLESVVDDEELDKLEALRSQPWAYEEDDNSTISERYGAVTHLSTAVVGSSRTRSSLVKAYIHNSIVVGAAS